MLAVRDPAKGERAASRIAVAARGAEPAVCELDLACLDSVRTAAAALRASYPTIDLLINNAGVMAVPPARSADGFELQLATNYLGPFVLTGLMLDTLRATPGSRVVMLSSIAAWNGRIAFDDFQHERRYRGMAVYSQSKLADLMFALALQRRLTAAGAKDPIAVAAHPGLSDTSLFDTRPGLRRLAAPLFQQPGDGALAPLRAATDPAARGGQYFGPAGFAETSGRPVPGARVRRAARAPDTQDRLWSLTEHLTGFDYGFGAARP